MNAITAMTLARMESADMAGPVGWLLKGTGAMNSEEPPSSFGAPGIFGNPTRQLPIDC
jgi:hypothetical protein